MSDEGLRAALQARLESLPLMVHIGNDYPTQALPKAELLDLLAAHSPTPTCTHSVTVHGKCLACHPDLQGRVDGGV